MNSAEMVPVIGAGNAVAPQNMMGAMIQSSVGGNSSSSREVAKVIGQIHAAMAFPRDEVQAMKKILQTCQRPSLAEKATYTYKRGGTEITGASIHLLTAIAGAWRNLNWGYEPDPEKTGTQFESFWVAFAFDKESNNEVRIPFNVRHVRYVKDKNGVGHNEPLTSDRDIYELVANNASRRVRKCLENIVPRDIVETALEECENTLRANVGKIDETRIDKMVKTFNAFGVSTAELETFIQRPLTPECVTPAILVRLMKICQSLKEGEPKETFFKTDGTKKEPEAGGKEKAASKPAKPKKPTVESFLDEHAEKQEKPVAEGEASVESVI